MSNGDRPNDDNDLSPAMAAHNEAVRRDFRRNVTAIVTWEFMWGLGIPFAMFGVAAPNYLKELGAPDTLIGVVISFPFLFAPMAILVSYWVKAHQRLRVYKAAVIGCIVPWFVYSTASTAWGAAWPRGFHIACYVLCMAIFIGTVHSLSPTFWAVMTDNTPVRRRGRLVGFRLACFCTGGLAVSYLAKRLYGVLESPLNFRVAFVITSSVFLVSCVCVFLIRDHVSPSHSQAGSASRPRFWSYLKDTLKQAWGDPNYRILLFFYALLASALTGMGFIVSAAREHLHASAEEANFFATVFLIGGGCLGWLPGLLADRFGYRLVGALSATLLAGGFLTCLITRNLTVWYVAYGACSVVSMVQYAILCNMGAEIRPDLPPNRLMATGISMSLVFVVTTNALCGALKDFTHLYGPSFVAYFTLSVIVALGFAFVVREPRTGRLYVIKPLRRP